MRDFRILPTVFVFCTYCDVVSMPISANGLKEMLVATSTSLLATVIIEEEVVTWSHLTGRTLKFQLIVAHNCTLTTQINNNCRSCTE